MFSEERSSPTVEVKKEGLRLLQTSPSLGTCIALPAIYHSIRYFEVEVVRNKGAVYVGTEASQDRFLLLSINSHLVT
jgi:hypothetical protein